VIDLIGARIATVGSLVISGFTSKTHRRLLVIEHEAKLRAALLILRPMVLQGIFIMLDAEFISLG